MSSRYCSTRLRKGRAWVAAGSLCCLLGPLPGCNSFFNSWFDPTQVGSFSRETTLDIRTSLSIQDTPLGIAGSSDPRPEDLIPVYEEYQIGHGDVLSIRIFELLAGNTETMTQTVVDEIGTISIPVLGQIRVSGMTRSEVEQELVEQLNARDILRDAQVVVDLAVKRNATYTIFGAIPQPNVYPLPKPDLRLLEAVNVAGGLVDTVTDIYVFRNEPSSATGADSVTWQGQGAGDVVTASAGLGTWAGGIAPPPPATEQPAGQTNDPPPALEPELDQELAELVEAVPSPDPENMLVDEAASQPTTRPATLPADEDIAEMEPVSRPRFIFLNGQWIETVAEPVPEPEPFVEPEIAPEAPLEQREMPSPAEPQIDWSRLAGDREYRIVHVGAGPLRNGDYRQNIVVRPDDSIRLLAGETGEYYIMGQVMRPGAYSITGRKVTLKTAIASAGNLAPLAWPDRCTVYRRYGDREEMHQVNLDAIFAGKEPDLFLKNNDLVLVGTHPAAPFLAVFRNAFRMTYGFGFVYDRNFADIDSFGGQPNPKYAERAGYGTLFPNLFR